jgi:hypothetical protein
MKKSKRYTASVRRRIRKNSADVFLKFGLARAEEGSGEESARVSEFRFGGVGKWKKYSENVKV